MITTTLYQISDAYLYFLESIESGEIPDEAIADTLESIECNFIDKTDNIACYIKSLNYDAQAIKAEIDILTTRLKHKKNKSERLTEYLHNCMDMLGKSKVETPRCLIQIKKNPPKVDLDENFIEWAKQNDDSLLKYKEPEPDKTRIKEALKNGRELPARLVQDKKLSIK